MKINSINQLTFKMKWSSHTHKTIDGYLSRLDEIILDNGKKLRITTEYKNGIKQTKLQYLIDSTGKWLKSKLYYFKNKKVLRGQNESISKN